MEHLQKPTSRKLTVIKQPSLETFSSYWQMVSEIWTREKRFYLCDGKFIFVNIYGDDKIAILIWNVADKYWILLLLRYELIRNAAIIFSMEAQIPVRFGRYNFIQKHWDLNWLRLIGTPMPHIAATYVNLFSPRANLLWTNHWMPYNIHYNKETKSMQEQIGMTMAMIINNYK